MIHVISEVEKPYIVLRSEKARLVARIQCEIMRASRHFLEKEDFLEVIPPIMEPFTDPGIRGAEFFEVDYYGKPYRLMTALTIHKPLLATHLGRVFAFCPCSRIEPEESSQTGRHLAQFYQIEVEVDKGVYKEAMKVLEDLIKFVIRKVKKRCYDELEQIGRTLHVPEKSFRIITHEEAVKMAKEMGLKADFEEELPWETEKAISFKFKEPFFITHYPKGSRGFYERDGKDRLLDFDLMYPEGFGEAASGSEREWEYEKVKKKIMGMEMPEIFEPYLEIMRSGIKPTAGFGLGLERLTRFICGLDHIKDATLFPKVAGVVSP